MKATMIKICLVAACGIALLALGCQQQVQEKAVPKVADGPKPEHKLAIKGSVREMEIGLEKPVFPEAEGKQEFTSYCSMCHSLKYISMQPDFPKKTWEAEVTKMVAKYHAPIDSVTCLKIVGYLVKVKSPVAKG